MKILGISAFYHDSAAALCKDGDISFALQEERLSRRKNDPSFPSGAVAACLASLRDGGAVAPDAVVFYEKPLLKFERLLETHYAFAPGGFPQFLSAMPVWVREKLFLRREIRRGLSEAGGPACEGAKLLFSSHHLSHAASAFFPSPFEEAAVLTMDGVGEWASGAIFRGAGGGIELLREQEFPSSLGLLYSAFTYYAGFRVNSGEYKLMGLAPYGRAGSGRVRRFGGLIRSELADLREDGSLCLNQEYFGYAAGLRMTRDGKWEELFGLRRRLPGEEISAAHCDLAMAIQDFTGEAAVRQAREARRLTGSRNLCMAGGVALNCVANSRIAEEAGFDEVWVQPAAGDAGGALGAALAAWHIYFGRPRRAGGGDRMKGAFLGPSYTGTEAADALAEAGAVFERMEDDRLFPEAASLLAAGAVVGWHQGRAEWGPRALGARSILADPRDPGMQSRLNISIKNREGFRPFAPAVLAEAARDYFERGTPSPYMLFTDRVRTRLGESDAGNEEGMTLGERLARRRSELAAATHLDYSARVQTVHAELAPRFHRLISEFKKLTGCGALLNTSFNVRGEPIVCSPLDAYRCFMSTGMDYLFIGNLFLDKKRQPPAAGPAAGGKDGDH